MSWLMSHGPQVCGNPACPLCSPYLARARGQAPAAPAAWPESAPDLTRKVLGYRLFMARGEHRTRLASVGVPNVWRPGVNDARCLLPPEFAGGHGRPHRAPDPQCACGLYAYHRPMAVWGTREYGFDAAGGLCTVAAVTLSWGRIELHHDGVRAEHAEILALITYPDHRRQLARVQTIAQAYGVRCMTEEEVRDLDHMRRFGEPVPEQLRPPPQYSSAGAVRLAAPTAALLALRMDGLLRFRAPVGRQI